MSAPTGAGRITPALLYELERIHARAETIADELDPKRRGGGASSRRELVVRELDKIGSAASFAATIARQDLEARGWR